MRCLRCMVNFFSYQVAVERVVLLAKVWQNQRNKDMQIGLQQPTRLKHTPIHTHTYTYTYTYMPINGWRCSNWQGSSVLLKCSEVLNFFDLDCISLGAELSIGPLQVVLQILGLLRSAMSVLMCSIIYPCVHTWWAWMERACPSKACFLTWLAVKAFTHSFSSEAMTEKMFGVCPDLCAVCRLGTISWSQ